MRLSKNYLDYYLELIWYIWNIYGTVEYGNTLCVYYIKCFWGDYVKFAIMCHLTQILDTFQATQIIVSQHSSVHFYWKGQFLSTLFCRKPSRLLLNLCHCQDRQLQLVLQIYHQESIIKRLFHKSYKIYIYIY